MINVLGGQTGDPRDQFSAEYELLRDVGRLPRHVNVVSVLHVFDDMVASARLPIEAARLRVRSGGRLAARHLRRHAAV